MQPDFHYNNPLFGKTNLRAHARTDPQAKKNTELTQNNKNKNIGTLRETHPSHIPLQSKISGPCFNPIFMPTPRHSQRPEINLGRSNSATPDTLPASPRTTNSSRPSSPLELALKNAENRPINIRNQLTQNTTYPMSSSKRVLKSIIGSFQKHQSHETKLNDQIIFHKTNDMFDKSRLRIGIVAVVASVTAAALIGLTGVGILVALAILAIARTSVALANKKNKILEEKAKLVIKTEIAEKYPTPKTTNIPSVVGLDDTFTIYSQLDDFQSGLSKFDKLVNEKSLAERSNSIEKFMDKSFWLINTFSRREPHLSKSSTESSNRVVNFARFCMKQSPKEHKPKVMLHKEMCKPLIEKEDEAEKINFLTIKDTNKKTGPSIKRLKGIFTVEARTRTTNKILSKLTLGYISKVGGYKISVEESDRMLNYAKSYQELWQVIMNEPSKLTSQVQEIKFLSNSEKETVLVLAEFFSLLKDYNVRETEFNHNLREMLKPLYTKPM